MLRGLSIVVLWPSSGRATRAHETVPGKAKWQTETGKLHGIARRTLLDHSQAPKQFFHIMYAICAYGHGHVPRPPKQFFHI